MQRMALVVAISLIAASSNSVSAQPSNVPATDVNCNDFTKQGPDTWIANGDVHLKIGGKDISLNNSTIKPGVKTTTGVDIYAFLESMCGGHQPGLDRVRGERPARPHADSRQARRQAASRVERR